MNEAQQHGPELRHVRGSLHQPRRLHLQCPPRALHDDPQRAVLGTEQDRRTNEPLLPDQSHLGLFLEVGQCNGGEDAADREQCMPHILPRLENRLPQVERDPIQIAGDGLHNVRRHGIEQLVAARRSRIK